MSRIQPIFPIPMLSPTWRGCCESHFEILSKLDSKKVEYVAHELCIRESLVVNMQTNVKTKDDRGDPSFVVKSLQG